MIKKKTGRIRLPKKSMVHPQELKVAEILVTTGEDVEFLPVSRQRTADICFRGLEWEIKSPIGSSSRTIENNLRNALKQSSNIIKQPEEKCLREVKRQAKLLHMVKRIIVLTKSSKIITLS